MASKLINSSLNFIAVIDFFFDGNICGDSFKFFNFNLLGEQC